MTPKIPLVNLERLWRRHEAEWTRALLEVAASSAFILGEHVRRFEAAFAEAIGARYCVGVASGTDAVHLSLRAAGVGPGDEVVTVANTFAATIEAILHAGATPVLVDVEEDTLLIDCDQVEAVVGKRTRAIVPVHLSGRAANLARLEKIAERHDLALIQDAAQAHGALYAGRSLGEFGLAATYSFFPGKNLGAFGDAGAVVTDDEEHARLLAQLRDHGRTGKYDHGILGFNSRLDTIHAAILLEKLPLLDQWNEHRRRAADLYRSLLEGRVRLVPETPDPGGVHHHFMVRVRDRERIREELARAGIATGIHYPIPIHRLEAFRSLGVPAGSLPVTEAAAEEILSLPIDPTIEDDEVRTVAAAVLQAIANE